MKKIILSFSIFHSVALLQAQNIGIGTATPHPSAVLEISSSNKGLLMPRVNDTSSVPNPVKGLSVYSLAQNKIWFYNGSRWQQIQSNAGGMDSLWYKTKDSISYSGKKYVSINTDPAFTSPQANLEVNGSLLIQSPQVYSRSSPSAAQSYTMSKQPTSIEVPETDSVFRILDPGGTNNYFDNTLSNVYANGSSVFNQDGYRLKFNQTNFGLGSGDTLWIGAFGFPVCRNNYVFRFTSTSEIPGELAYADSWLFFTFKSDNVSTGKGFDIRVNRVFSSAVPANSTISTTGNALQFSNGSLAAGYNVNAKYRGSIALGSFANANGRNSVAIGSGALANGFSSVSMGAGSVAEAEYTFALGGGYAAGYGALAFGLNSIAAGQYSVALGYGAKTYGHAGFAAGVNTISKTSAGTVLGIANDTSDISNPLNPAATDRLFQIGNGINGLRSNALTILRNGNVGIGTVNPRALLQFPNTIANRKIVLWETYLTDLDYFGFGINDYTLRYNVPAGNNFHSFYAGNKLVFNIASNGNAILAGTLSQNSDARLKKAITPLSNNLLLLNSLNGYSYYWKDEARGHAEQIGLLAQEVQQTFPQLVNTDDAGMLSVNYAGLTPVLIEAIKELNRKIEKQQEQIDQLLKPRSK